MKNTLWQSTMLYEICGITTINQTTMKIIILLTLLFFFSACKSGKKDLSESLDIIPVECANATEDASSFLEKIEIVPLETTDSSLLFHPRKVIYNKEMDMYAFFQRGSLVYTFSGDGKYIGNSEKVRGKGPGEYYMALDVQFNPYLRGIDLLNPYGKIYTYTPTFELVSERKYDQEFPVTNFMPLDSVNYLFSYPAMRTNQEVSFENIATGQKINTTYKGTISSDNYMSDDCFYKHDGIYNFVPFGLNYYLYQIDKESKKLLPVAYLDFGEKEIKEDNLPGCAAGIRTKEDSESAIISQKITERSNYLKKSSEVLPLIRLFNEDFVYVFMVEKTMPGYTYIFNRNKKEGFLLKDGTPMDIYFCFDVVDNVLLSLCPTDELSGFVDRKFMSQKEIDKMENLKEDDNPVIIKYYLKR